MILYFGNDLTNNSILNLYCKHLSEISTVKSASHYKNRILRLFHMVYIFLRYFWKTKLIIIEVYSGWAFYYAWMISILSRLFSVSYIPVLHGGNLSERIKRSSKLSSMVFRYSKKNITP